MKAIITYIRYDSTRLQTANSKAVPNITLELYHIDLKQVLVPIQPKPSLETCRAIVNEEITVRQHIATSTILNDTVVEYDGLCMKLTGLDDNSGLVIFVYRNKEIIDYYFMQNALADLDGNPNLVYNTDSHYLIEINKRVDQVNEIRSKKHTSEKSYKDIYDKFLEEELIKFLQQKLDREELGNLDAAKVNNLYKLSMADIKSNKQLVDQIGKKSVDQYHRSYLDALFAKYLKSEQITTDMYADPNITIDLIHDMIRSARCVQADSFGTDDTYNKLSIHYKI